MHLKGPRVSYLFYSCCSEECKSFPGLLSSLPACLHVLDTSGHCRWHEAPVFRQSVKLTGKNSTQGLVNGGLLDAVKGRLIILRQTPTFATLNSFVALFDWIFFDNRS